jgi:pteridine reductase
MTRRPSRPRRAAVAPTKVAPEPVLAGRTVLVTGGCRRVGAAIARRLSDEGADLVLHTRRTDDAAREFAASLPGRSTIVEADLAKGRGAERLFAGATKRGFEADAVVHAAASFVRAAPLALDADQWSEVMDTNLRSFYLLARAFADRRRGGDLVAISDSGARELWPGYLAHCVSKAALLSLVDVLAKAMAPGFRVNAVLPGPVLPPAEASADEKRRMGERTLLRRVGTPEDVAHAVSYLLTSSYSTGTTIEVTGGAHLWRSPKA